MTRTPLLVALLATALAAPVSATEEVVMEPVVAPEEAPRGESYYQYCLSQQAWFDRDYDAALDHMKRAAEANPGSVQLTLDLAELHLDLRQPREAVTVAKRAIEQAPDLPAARDILARALLTVAEGNDATPEDREEALGAVMELLRIDPNNGQAYLALARLQIARGRMDQAMQALEQHLEQNPDSEEGIFMVAQVLTKLERYSEAEPFLRRAIANQPADPRLRLALIEVHEASGDLGSAYSEAMQLLQLRVDPVRVRLTLARLSEMMNKPDEAIEHFREIEKVMDEQEDRYPAAERSEVQLRMILLLLQSKRTDEAVEVASAGMKRFPGDDRFRLRKGEALLVAGKPKEARETMREKEAMTAKDAAQMARIAEAYLSAGARVERGGDQAAAERHLARAIELDPHNDTALNYLGFMLADHGTRLDEAIGYIRRALEKEPANGAYLDSLGWAYFKKKDYAQAEKHLLAAREAMSDEPEIHQHLGELYFATGRMEEALRSWQEALDRGAENTDEILARMSAARKAVVPHP